MPEEFQPYFYLSHKDLNSPQPGKVIGFLLLFVFFILLLLKLLGRWALSWPALLTILVFAIISLYIGKIIHHEKNSDNKEEEPDAHEPKDPPQIIEEGHSL
ncbi:MAG: hypothetical protein AABX51_05940 [Nanoarchaeota archaeon]